MVNYLDRLGVTMATADELFRNMAARLNAVETLAALTATAVFDQPAARAMFEMGRKRIMSRADLSSPAREAAIDCLADLLDLERPAKPGRPP